MKNSRQQIIQNETKKGFTIIEVTLSMAFIGMLVIAIAMILVNILSLYQKGAVVKSVNSVGRGLISELTSAINAAPSIDSTSLCNTLVSGTANIEECLAEGANSFIYQSHTGYKQNDNGVSQPVQYYGVLCTGKYTYMWNTYQAIDSGKTLKLRYNASSSRTNLSKSDNFKIIRFEDRNYRACSSIATSAQSKRNFENDGIVDVRTLPNGASYYVKEPVDGFLDNTDVDLYLYELTMFPISQDVVTLRAFFSGTFILATDRGDVNILRTGNYCNPNTVPGTDNAGSTLDLGSEFNYCAINKFNFAARTAGSSVNK